MDTLANVPSGEGQGDHLGQPCRMSRHSIGSRWIVPTREPQGGDLWQHRSTSPDPTGSLSVVTTG